MAGADWSDNPLTRLCDALEAFPVPTVAGLNGGAYGGGVELALACDFRIGVTGMRAFAPPARLGIHYEPAGIARVIDRLGSQAARRMFLLAETFDAPALLAAGFLDRLVEPEELPRQARRAGRRARRPGAAGGARDEAHHPGADAWHPRRGGCPGAGRGVLRLRGPRRGPGRPARAPGAALHRPLTLTPSGSGWCAGRAAPG